jgi:hypothetical protein
VTDSLDSDSLNNALLPGGPGAMLNTILLMILIGMIPCGIIVIGFEIAANRKLRQRP